MKFLSCLIRRKYFNLESIENTKLRRCLSLSDLIFLGVGSTLGAGIYVVAGQVAKDKAGPAVVLSFLIAAVASMLAGICYAEFGARVPKAGSAYVYSYVTVGEFIAFIIGWNLILEYVIGVSSVARSASVYFDSLTGQHMKKYLTSHLPMDASGLSKYPDFFAFFLVSIVTVLLSIGVKESTTLNTIFTLINLSVVLYVIVCGLFKADIDNWLLPPDQVGPKEVAGKGGFFPFGFAGMFSGAATCFYAFVGFDVIASTGEEAKNPQRNIPLSIIVSLVIISVAYVSISSVLTLMVPYFDVDPEVPFPVAFSRVGYTVAKYIISFGAVCALSTSLLGAMFPLPRVLYALADDGLIFTFLAIINQRFKTPLIATVISGLFAGIMAIVFDLEELVNMMSIGTLLAYTLVAECVLILRYMTEDTSAISDNSSMNVSSDSSTLQNRRWNLVSQILSQQLPTKTTMKIAIVSICLMSISIFAFNSIIIFSSLYSWWAILLGSIFGSTMLLSLVILWILPQSPATSLKFKVPLVPLLPSFSIYANLFLMLKLPNTTWVRFGIWMAIGFLIYFGYGIRHSRQKEKDAPLLLDNNEYESEIDRNT